MMKPLVWATTLGVARPQLSGSKTSVCIRSPGKPCKNIKIAGPHPQNFWRSRPGWGLRICIFNKFPKKVLATRARRRERSGFWGTNHKGSRPWYRSQPISGKPSRCWNEQWTQQRPQGLPLMLRNGQTIHLNLHIHSTASDRGQTRRGQKYLTINTSSGSHLHTAFYMPGTVTATENSVLTATLGEKYYHPLHTVSEETETQRR